VTAEAAIRPAVPLPVREHGRADLQVRQPVVGAVLVQVVDVTAGRDGLEERGGDERVDADGRGAGEADGPVPLLVWPGREDPPDVGASPSGDPADPSERRHLVGGTVRDRTPELLGHS
jgi:hypothetical protein